MPLRNLPSQRSHGWVTDGEAARPQTPGNDLPSRDLIWNSSLPPARRQSESLAQDELEPYRLTVLQTI